MRKPNLDRALIIVACVIFFCLTGAIVMAVICTEPLTSAQNRVLDMLNYGWQCGLLILAGLFSVRLQE